MALPTPESTWVHNINNAAYVSESTEEIAARRLQIIVKNFICGQLRVAYEGAFADQGGGPPKTSRYTPTEVYDSNGVSGFQASDVGKDIEFRNAGSAGNDGQFTITAVDPGGTWCEFENDNVVVESYTGASARVIDPAWQGVVNSRSPWRCKGSGTGSLGRGSALDGLDRWTTVSWNNQSSTSGNRTWFVFENEINGAEMLWWNDTSTTSSQWIHMVIRMSPELGFTGGGATTAPTAVDDTEVNSRSADWMGYGTPNSDLNFLNMMVSDDGEQTMMWNAVNGQEYFVFHSRKPADVVNDALIPWNGERNLMDWSIGTGSFTTATFNDGAHFRGTIDKDASAGGHYEAAFYLTTEMVVNETATQLNSWWMNEVVEEFALFSIGLATETTGVRGRHGRLPDMWYTNDVTTTVQIHSGAGMPNDGSYQFMKIGHFIFPWNGQKYRTR